MARLARREMIGPSVRPKRRSAIRSVAVPRVLSSVAMIRLAGESHEHRRQWIRDRLQFLASVFGIDCLTNAIMSNHIQ